MAAWTAISARGWKAEKVGLPLVEEGGESVKLPSGVGVGKGAGWMDWLTDIGSIV